MTDDEIVETTTTSSTTTTAAEVEIEDAANRKARTGTQAFSGVMFVTVLVWVLRLNGVDLNPLPDQEDIPAEVSAALTGILTYVAAVWMNRRRT